MTVSFSPILLCFNQTGPQLQKYQKPFCKFECFDSRQGAFYKSMVYTYFIKGE